jgi:hypothetical protein
LLTFREAMSKERVKTDERRGKYRCDGIERGRSG